MSNGLDIALMRDPYAEWSPLDWDHHTEIAFSYDEWDSFFIKTLEATDVAYVQGEPYEEYEKRRAAAFRESLAGYPLLARIDEFYQDACYSAQEILPLQNELHRVVELLLDDETKAFLEGMLAGCSAALTENMGIRHLSS
jgi:hypothetical protein